MNDPTFVSLWLGSFFLFPLLVSYLVGGSTFNKKHGLQKILKFSELAKVFSVLFLILMLFPLTKKLRIQTKDFFSWTCMELRDQSYVTKMGHDFTFYPLQESGNQAAGKILNIAWKAPTFTICCFLLAILGFAYFILRRRERISEHLKRKLNFYFSSLMLSLGFTILFTLFSLIFDAFLPSLSLPFLLLSVGGILFLVIVSWPLFRDFLQLILSMWFTSEGGQKLFNISRSMTYGIYMIFPFYFGWLWTVYLIGYLEPAYVGTITFIFRSMGLLAFFVTVLLYLTILSAEAMIPKTKTLEEEIINFATDREHPTDKKLSISEIAKELDVGEEKVRKTINESDRLRLEVG